MSKSVHFSWARVRAAALCAPLALVLGACGDTLVSPVTRAPASADAVKLLSGGSRLNPTSVKYHDGAGTSHATGRSGSATLQGVAVLGPDGVTRLTITTGDLDHLAQAPGEIVKAQLKASHADGSRIFVDNRNGLGGSGTQTFLLRGLIAGDRVEVQANVRGIDGRRTDVVTLTAGVVHAPVLNVDVTLPPATTSGTPTVIVGTVSETGGDLGTTSTCQLIVNGVVVDRATGVWVDAGDAVTCAFTWTPPGPGSYDVVIQVTPDTGGGLLGSVVTDGGTLVVNSADHASYAATAQYSLLTTSSIWDYSWWKPDGSHKEYSETNASTQRSQSIQAQVTLSRPVVFPLVGASVAMVSNGITWENENWSGLPGVAVAGGQVCASQQVAAQGVLFSVCNGLQGATVSYTRFAGTVVYHSEGFGRIWDGLTSTATNWSWNDTYEEYGSGGQIRPLGSTVTVNVGVSDVSGSFNVSPTITLTPYSRALGTTPRSCVTEYLYWLDGGAQTSCTSGSRYESGAEGSTTG